MNKKMPNQTLHKTRRGLFIFSAHSVAGWWAKR